MNLLAESIWPGEFSRRVAGADLIDAYMALHPKWTTRGAGPSQMGTGSVWIETWESEVVASARYSTSDPGADEAGELTYAHVFVAVSVGEFFALLVCAQ